MTKNRSTPASSGRASTIPYGARAGVPTSAPASSATCRKATAIAAMARSAWTPSKPRCSGGSAIGCGMADVFLSMGRRTLPSGQPSSFRGYGRGDTPRSDPSQRPRPSIPPHPPPGALAANVLEFARLLRRAGLPVGSADMLAAVAALDQVGVASRGRCPHRPARDHGAPATTRRRCSTAPSPCSGATRPAAQSDAIMALLGDTAPRPEPRPAPGSRRVGRGVQRPPGPSRGRPRRRRSTPSSPSATPNGCKPWISR